MVAGLDNDTINNRSQVDNSYHSTNAHLIEILRNLQKNDEELIHLIKRNQIDINAFNDEPVSGIVTVQNPVRQPILITDIIATWTVNQPVAPNAVSSTSPQIGLSFQTRGIVTPTTALQALATIVNPPSGDYYITVNSYLDGAITAADQDNIQISWNGGSQIIFLLQPSNANAPVVTNRPFLIGGINGVNSLIIRTTNIPSG